MFEGLTVETNGGDYLGFKKKTFLDAGRIQQYPSVPISMDNH